MANNELVLPSIQRQHSTLDLPQIQQPSNLFQGVQDVYRPGTGPKLDRDDYWRGPYKRPKQTDPDDPAPTPERPSALTYYIDSQMGEMGGIELSGDNSKGAVISSGRFKGKTRGQAFEALKKEFLEKSPEEVEMIQAEADKLGGYSSPDAPQKSGAEMRKERYEQTGNPYRSHDRSASGFKPSASQGSRRDNFALRSEAERLERNAHYRFNDITRRNQQHQAGKSAVAAMKAKQQSTQPQVETSLDGNQTRVKLPDGSYGYGKRPQAPQPAVPQQPAFEPAGPPKSLSNQFTQAVNEFKERQGMQSSIDEDAENRRKVAAGEQSMIPDDESPLPETRDQKPTKRPPVAKAPRDRSMDFSSTPTGRKVSAAADFIGKSRFAKAGRKAGEYQRAQFDKGFEIGTKIRAGAESALKDLQRLRPRSR